MAGLLEKWGLIPKRVSSDIVENALANLNGDIPQLDQREQIYREGLLNQKNIYDEALKKYNRLIR